MTYYNMDNEADRNNMAQTFAEFLNEHIIRTTDMNDTISINSLFTQYGDFHYRTYCFKYPAKRYFVEYIKNNGYHIDRNTNNVCGITIKS